MDVTVPAGAEIFRCEFVRMPKTADGGDQFVSAMAHDYTPGSHHLLLFRTDVKAIPTGLDGVRDCNEGDSAMKYARGYVSGGQTPHERRELPAGIGLPFASDEVLLLQVHYVNAGKTDLTASVKVMLDLADKASIHQRAGVLRMYDPFIYVPASGTAKATERCPIKHDITLLGAGSHMHRRGVAFKAWVDAPGAPPAATPLFTNEDWQHPIDWIGPLAVAKGSFVRFECAYQNGDPRAVVQGESAELNEMCMLSGIYYPEMPAGDDTCTDFDSVGTGTASCQATSACLQACPPGDIPTVFDSGPPKIGACSQQCMTASCPNAYGPLIAQASCAKKACPTECASAGDACTQCVIANCLTQAVDCQNTTCGP